MLIVIEAVACHSMFTRRGKPQLTRNIFCMLQMIFLHMLCHFLRAELLILLAVLSGQTLGTPANSGQSSNPWQQLKTTRIVVKIIAMQTTLLPSASTFLCITHYKKARLFIFLVTVSIFGIGGGVSFRLCFSC